MSYSGSTELSHIKSAYSNIGTEIPAENISSDSLEISKELKKLLSEGCTLPMSKNFLDIIELDSEYETLASTNENYFIVLSNCIFLQNI